MLTKYKLKFPTFIAKNHLWSATFVILRIRRGNIGDRISVKNWRSLPGSLLKLKDYFKPIRRLIRYSISTRTNIKIQIRSRIWVFMFEKVTWDHPIKTIFASGIHAPLGRAGAPMTKKVLQQLAPRVPWIPDLHGTQFKWKYNRIMSYKINRFLDLFYLWSIWYFGLEMVIIQSLRDQPEPLFSNFIKNYFY